MAAWNARSLGLGAGRSLPVTPCAAFSSSPSRTNKSHRIETAQTVRNKAADIAHHCEAFAKARPSVYNPLFIPRQSKIKASDATSPSNNSKNEKTSFFRRPLSEELIAFSSIEGKKLFKDVLLNATLKSKGGHYVLPILSAFEMQKHPVSCGLASIAIALNALKVATWRNVLGQRRVILNASSLSADDFNDDFEAVTEEEVNQSLLDEEERSRAANFGVSLQDVGNICRKVPNLGVEIVHARSTVTVDDFRSRIQACLESPRSHAESSKMKRPEQVMIVNFSRPALHQSGSGHFSPIACWHASEDVVLLLDTARFKYPAFWVPVVELWQACATSDSEKMDPRGFLTLSR